MGAVGRARLAAGGVVGDIAAVGGALMPVVGLGGLPGFRPDVGVGQNVQSPDGVEQDGVVSYPLQQSGYGDDPNDLAARGEGPAAEGVALPGGRGQGDGWALGGEGAVGHAGVLVVDGVDDQAEGGGDGHVGLGHDKGVVGAVGRIHIGGDGLAALVVGGQSGQLVVPVGGDGQVDRIAGVDPVSALGHRAVDDALGQLQPLGVFALGADLNQSGLAGSMGVGLLVAELIVARLQLVQGGGGIGAALGDHAGPVLAPGRAPLQLVGVRRDGDGALDVLIVDVGRLKDAHGLILPQLAAGGHGAALVGDGGLGLVALGVCVLHRGAAGEDDIALVVQLRAVAVPIGHGDGGGAALAVGDGQGAVRVIDQGYAAGGHVQAVAAAGDVHLGLVAVLIGDGDLAALPLGEGDHAVWVDSAALALGDGDGVAVLIHDGGAHGGVHLAGGIHLAVAVADGDDRALAALARGGLHLGAGGHGDLVLLAVFPLLDGHRAAAREGDGGLRGAVAVLVDGDGAAGLVFDDRAVGQDQSLPGLKVIGIHPVPADLKLHVPVGHGEGSGQNVLAGHAVGVQQGPAAEGIARPGQAGGQGEGLARHRVELGGKVAHGVVVRRIGHGVGHQLVELLGHDVPAALHGAGEGHHALGLGGGPGGHRAVVPGVGGLVLAPVAAGALMIVGAVVRVLVPGGVGFKVVAQSRQLLVVLRALHHLQAAGRAGVGDRPRRGTGGLHLGLLGGVAAVVAWGPASLQGGVGGEKIIRRDLGVACGVIPAVPNVAHPGLGGGGQVGGGQLARGVAGIVGHAVHIHPEQPQDQLVAGLLHLGAAALAGDEVVGSLGIIHVGRPAGGDGHLLVVRDVDHVGLAKVHP